MPSLHFLLLTLLVKVAIATTPLDRCNSDPAYSVRVCRAIQTFFGRRRPCDTTENQRLKAQIKFLQVALNELLRQRSSDSNCPGTTYRGDCYFLLDKNGYGSLATYENAQAACGTNQGRLVCIDNKGLYDHIYNFVERSSHDVINESRKLVLMWTGAAYENGKIILENNSTSSFTSWSTHHPMNITGRNRVGLAVATSPQVRGMFDASPSMKLYPLCKKN